MRCQLQTLRCVVVSRSRQLNIVLCLFFAVQFVQSAPARTDPDMSAPAAVQLVKAERSIGAPFCMHVTFVLSADLRGHLTGNS